MMAQRAVRTTRAARQETPMTAEIVNLRQVRKQKARADKERQAAQNRAKFGRSKEARDLESAETARHRRALDAHQRDTDTVNTAVTDEEPTT
jgi:hypothetical protein